MYEGQKAAIGQLMGNGLAAQNAPTPPATISSSIEIIDCQVEYVSSLVSRIRGVADRLHGGEPRPVTTQGVASPDKGPVLSALRIRQERLDYALSELSPEIDRIERAI